MALWQCPEVPGTRGWLLNQNSREAMAQAVGAAQESPGEVYHEFNL